MLSFPSSYSSHVNDMPQTYSHSIHLDSACSPKDPKLNIKLPWYSFVHFVTALQLTSRHFGKVHSSSERKTRSFSLLPVGSLIYHEGHTSLLQMSRIHFVSQASHPFSPQKSRWLMDEVVTWHGNCLYLEVPNSNVPVFSENSSEKGAPSDLLFNVDIRWQTVIKRSQCLRRLKKKTDWKTAQRMEFT